MQHKGDGSLSYQSQSRPIHKYENPNRKLYNCPQVVCDFTIPIFMTVYSTTGMAHLKVKISHMFYAVQISMFKIFKMLKLSYL